MKMLWFLILLILDSGAPPQEPELLERSGMVENPHLQMLFEATLFQLDVAEVEAFLSTKTAVRLLPLLSERSPNREKSIRAAGILMEADSVVFRLRFLRDLSRDRLLNRTRDNLFTAVDAGEWTREEFDRVWPSVEAGFSPLTERGVRKGDTLYYVVLGDTVECLVYGSDGALILRFLQSGTERARGTRAAFFAPGSDFREKLIESLFFSDSP